MTLHQVFVLVLLQLLLLLLPAFGLFKMFEKSKAAGLESIRSIL